MLIDLKDKKEEIHRIHEEDLFRIGHFKATQDLANITEGTIVKGTWPVILVNGEKFDAIGTLKNYDALLKILIHRTIAKKKSKEEKNDIMVK